MASRQTKNGQVKLDVKNTGRGSVLHEEENPHTKNEPQPTFDSR